MSDTGGTDKWKHWCLQSDTSGLIMGRSELDPRPESGGRRTEKAPIAVGA